MGFIIVAAFSQFDVTMCGSLNLFDNVFSSKCYFLFHVLVIECGPW